MIKYLNLKNKLSFFLLVFFILLCSSIQANNIKNSAVVLMYHKFNKSNYPSTNISMEQFKLHLEELSKPEYNVMPLNLIIDSIINDVDLPNKTIGISVDDADRSFLEHGWPLLKKYNFPVTLFVTTNTISDTNKNYLNWEEIRALKDQGVTIGAHSHTHSHLSKFSIKQIKEELETSNKIFLREIKEIPNIFAYPYGETKEEIFSLLKDYKFKVAFGQHSGVINETSNFYYLPRFSLNQKYGDIDRVKFAINSKGMGVYDFVPSNPAISENPPFIGFSLLDQSLSKNIDCFLFDNKGQIEKEIFKFNERIEIRLKRKIEKGRTRMNCTAKDDKGNWRWFGQQFIL